MVFTTNPILIAAAIIPALLLLRSVYRADRLEKEPARLLIALVLCGVLATFAALVAEKLGERILVHFVPADTTAYNAIYYFLVVALAEEGSKYLLLRWRTWRDEAFNCQFDGVVYAVFVSLGFALWENIGYVALFGLGTALVRAVTAVPGHACFGVFMGAFYGLAKRYDNFGDRGKSRVCRRHAVIMPMVLHGTYDFIATLEFEGYALIFLAFVLLLFASARRMIRRLSRDDRFIDYKSYDDFDF